MKLKRTTERAEPTEGLIVRADGPVPPGVVELRVVVDDGDELVGPAPGAEL